MLRAEGCENPEAVFREVEEMVGAGTNASPNGG
jgi:hypothetical protein